MGPFVAASFKPTSAPPEHVEIPLFEAMVKNGGPGQQPAKENFLVKLVYFDDCYSVDECYFDDCWVVFVGQHSPSVDSLSVPCPSQGVIW
jgi:hypothetical protein